MLRVDRENPAIAGDEPRPLPGPIEHHPGAGDLLGREQFSKLGGVERAVREMSPYQSPCQFIFCCETTNRTPSGAAWAEDGLEVAGRRRHRDRGGVDDEIVVVGVNAIRREQDAEGRALVPQDQRRRIGEDRRCQLECELCDRQNLAAGAGIGAVHDARLRVRGARDEKQRKRDATRSRTIVLPVPPLPCRHRLV